MEDLSFKHNDNIQIENITIQEARLVLEILGPESSVFKTSNDEGKVIYNFGYRAVKIEYYWGSLSYLIADGDFLFALLYFVFSM